MYSTVPSSTRLSSGSNPFRMPLACRNHREEKQRGVREAAVLGPVQSGYPMCRCGGQPLQGRERRDTGSGVRVRAGSRPEARRSSPTPPQNGASNVFAKGLWGSFSSVGPWSGPAVSTATTRLAFRGEAAPGHADAREWLHHAETPLTETETCDKRLIVFKRRGCWRRFPPHRPRPAHGRSGDTTSAAVCRGRRGPRCLV